MKIILIFLAAAVLASTTTPPQQILGNSVAPYTRPIENIFYSFPSEEDLQHIIYSADAVALTKLMQIIETKGDQISCEAIGVYSDSIIGMIKSALHRKQLLIAQMNAIYENAKSEIERIQGELERLNSEKNRLQVDELRDAILTMILQLNNSYDIINEEEDNVEGFEAQLIGYRTQIRVKESQLGNKRALFNEKKIQLGTVDAQIAQTQRHLAYLRSQRAIIKSDAEEISNKIDQITSYITTTRQKISGLEGAIDIRNQKIDHNKRKAAELQVSLQRSRSDLASERNKQISITNQIEVLKNQLTIQEGRFLQTEYKTLQNMIRVWKQILPNFEEQNAEIYYECYGEGSVDTLRTGEVNVYVLKGVNIPSYIFDNYGVQPLSLSTRSSYQFYIVDVFGSSWSTRYGRAFDESSSLLESNDLYIPGDFTCLNPSLVQSGKGTILEISNRTIRVRDENKKTIDLSIGACSRIEATSYIPRPGQSIYYKGIPLGSKFNLYTASCFEA